MFFLEKKLKNFLSDPPPPSRRRTHVAPECAEWIVLQEFLRHPDIPVLTAVADSAAADRLESALRQLAGESGTALHLRRLPETVRGKLISADNEQQRARTLLESLNRPTDIVIGTLHAFTTPCPPPERLLTSTFAIRPGDRLSPGELAARLTDMDYDDEAEVTGSGEFSRRGGIFDLFSPAHTEPCRIEFFGDEVDTIRTFDPVTQRSTGQTDVCHVALPHPSTDAARDPEHAVDFFTCWQTRPYRLITCYPADCEKRLHLHGDEAAAERFRTIRQMLMERGVAVDIEDTVAPEPGDEDAGCLPPLAHLTDTLPDEVQFGALALMRQLLRSAIHRWIDTGCTILLAAPDRSGIDQLRTFWAQEGFPAHTARIIESRLLHGIQIPARDLILLTERELLTVNAFGEQEAAPPPERINQEMAAQLRNLGENRLLAELNEGDYAVHLQHGLAIYRGLAVVTTAAGITREIIKLEFADQMMLHVPLEQADAVSRYLGSAGRLKLHRLGGSRWGSDRKRAESAIARYAAEMLRLQAVRSSITGRACPADDDSQLRFERSFPWNDTPDQQRSTREIKKDLMTPRPMDRLLCGDVGYGKTEVAIRAAFKMVSCGRQVAVLAPTTVLARQHLHSFRERFAGYPFVIEELSRLCTPGEQRRVTTHLATGGVDIVIGTHALCSNKLKFHDLGLVIIDEEQRFGVKDKDILRQLRVDVDVLSMSATPIPRTLYLAMAGARDLSTLQTPPRERIPVKTIIAPATPDVITAAIREEIGRGGQVFYLHNRVRTIEDCRDKLAAMLPEVRFGIAHGQLSEPELSQVMNDFTTAKLDCLICSTIIESGIDLPNANTIIIERADRFGLAQLYQLRGRVGRRNVAARAYLLMPPSELLTGNARKRIAAIRRCSNLGGGFQLALHDLEIRGAGNLLGVEQSGHLNAIGFDLYCRLLRQEVARMKGEHTLPSAEVVLDFVEFGHRAPAGILPAAIPPDYIPDPPQRIHAYRRLAALPDLEAWQDLQNEFTDRYGAMPEPLKHLFTLSEFRIRTAAAGYTSLSLEDGKVLLKSPRGIYRRNGAVPLISSKNPPALRLALLRDILIQAAQPSPNGES